MFFLFFRSWNLQPNILICNGILLAVVICGSRCVLYFHVKNGSFYLHVGVTIVCFEIVVGGRGLYIIWVWPENYYRKIKMKVTTYYVYKGDNVFFP